MNILCHLLAAAVFAMVSSAVNAQGLVLPSDIGVTLTAAPSTQLAPEQPVTFTLTVTNLGTLPVPAIELTSSIWVDQFFAISTSIDCYLGTVVLDPISGPPAYYFYWNVGVPGSTGLAAGETRTCHFQLALTPQAPATTLFSFGLSSYYTDPNPSNNTATVSLQRAVATIPTLSPAMLLLLAGLLAVTAGIVHRHPKF